MLDELREAGAERFTAQANRPLQSPAPSGSGAAVDGTLRAHILEYIAAQLGKINAKLDTIVTTFPASGRKE